MGVFGNSICAAFLVVGSSIIASPASSAGRCWSEAEQASARVRDLQTRFMVASLQCQAREPAVLAAYNRFVVAHRAAIGRHNDAIRGYFITTQGRAGERGYDRFTTSLANTHGLQTSAVSDCQAMIPVIQAATKSSAAQLAALAESMGADPKLPGGACEVRIASRR